MELSMACIDFKYVAYDQMASFSMEDEILLSQYMPKMILGPFVCG